MASLKYKTDIIINGNRAILGLVKKDKKGIHPIDIQFGLFDKNILPILLYESEIWGYSNIKRLEKLHMQFCKLFLRLKDSVPIIMVYRETGWFDLEYYAKKTIASGNKKLVTDQVP